jgi:acyl carrier protein
VGDIFEGLPNIQSTSFDEGRMTMKQDSTQRQHEPQTAGDLGDSNEPAVIKSAISAWAVRYIEDQGISPVAVDESTPIEDYGLDSLAAVEMSGELSNWLGHEVDAMLVYQFSSIDELSGALAEQPSIRSSFARGGGGETA